MVAESEGSVRRAVFLDRDGVVNRAVLRAGKPYPPASPAELEILPGVATGLHQLKAAGFELIVVTNQPDVARGTQTREQVEALHVALQAQLSIDEFRVCYHDDADHCDCRKPKPGLLLGVAREHDIDLAASYLIGDRWRDVAAGQAAGCKCLFIDYGYAETQPAQPFVRSLSFGEAVVWILAQN